MMGTKVLFTIIVNFLVISTTVTAICEYEQDGAYIAHPESRHMFYYCWGGIGYEGECYAGQEFDPFYRVCTDIQEDDWGTPSCDRVQNGAILADPSSDRSFFICFNGLPHQVQCQEDEIFDSQQQRCAPLQSGGRQTTRWWSTETDTPEVTASRTQPTRTTTVRTPPTRTTTLRTPPTRTTLNPTRTTRQTIVPTRTTTRNIGTRSTTTRSSVATRRPLP